MENNCTGNEGILLSIPFLPLELKELKGIYENTSVTEIDSFNPIKISIFELIETNLTNKNGTSRDMNSFVTNIFSNETIKPPKVTISQLCLNGEDGYCSIMKIFNFEVANTNKAELNEKKEFKTNDSTKASPDTNLKSRGNEM